MEAKEYAIKQSMDHWRNKKKKEIEKYLETNKNENTMIQNLWNRVKAVLREKFLEMPS